jgi:hypothetical protein
VVDDYVAAARASRRRHGGGVQHGWGAAPSNRELVAWMRGRNAAHDPRTVEVRRPSTARWSITNAAAPRAALLTAHGFLAAHVDPDLLTTDAARDRAAGRRGRPLARFEAMMAPRSRSGAPRRCPSCRSLAEDLLAMFDSELPPWSRRPR